MKLAPANGINVHKLAFVLVFVPEMDIFTFSTCFSFQIIYQVGGLQKVLVTNTIVTF